MFAKDPTDPPTPQELELERLDEHAIDLFRKVREAAMLFSAAVQKAIWDHDECIDVHAVWAEQDLAERVAQECVLDEIRLKEGVHRS